MLLWLLMWTLLEKSTNSRKLHPNGNKILEKLWGPRSKAKSSELNREKLLRIRIKVKWTLRYRVKANIKRLWTKS